MAWQITRAAHDAAALAMVRSPYSPMSTLMRTPVLTHDRDLAYHLVFPHRESDEVDAPLNGLSLLIAPIPKQGMQARCGRSRGKFAHHTARQVEDSEGGHLSLEFPWASKDGVR